MHQLQFPNHLKVAKYGGSSGANATRIRKMGEQVRTDRYIRDLVVSAPGKDAFYDAKMTDDLRELAEAELQGKSPGRKVHERVVERFRQIERELCGNTQITANLPDLIRMRLELVAKQRRMAPLEAVGEKVQHRIVARHLNDIGLRAVCLDSEEHMIVDRYNNGVVYVPPSNYSRLGNALVSSLREYDVVVRPGYYGVTWDGDILTFNRGGSDLTAAVDAAALAKVGVNSLGYNGVLHENWTDKDGISVTDYKPLIDRAPRISIMGFLELAQLTLGGSFGIFMAEAVAPLTRAGVPIHVRSAFGAGEGTWIVPDHLLDPDYVQNNSVRGIALRPDFVRASLVQLDMGAKPGYFASVSEGLKQGGVSANHMPTSEIGISVVASANAIGGKEQAELFAESLGARIHADSTSHQGDLSIIAIVGNGLTTATGVAGRILSALGTASINISMLIYEGGNSFIIGVQNGQAAKAFELIYNQFFGSK